MEEKNKKTNKQTQLNPTMEQEFIVSNYAAWRIKINSF